MTYPIVEIEKLGLPQPQGIIHVGANNGCEFDSYKRVNPEIVLYIEPIPSIYEELKNRISNTVNHFALQYLCSDIDNEDVVFNVASNNGLSSSFLPLGRHEEIYPDIQYVDSFRVQTRTVDSLLRELFPHIPENKFQLLVIDTQGCDLKVLGGCHRLLRNGLKYVSVEISEEPLYEGGCTHEQITDFLKLYGFRMKNMFIHSAGWGEAFYVKHRKLAIFQSFGNNSDSNKISWDNLALHKPCQQSSYYQFFTPELVTKQSAVNGIKNGQFSFHTEKEVNPWWQVDLEKCYELKEIKIYNRLNSCSERARTLRVLLSSDGGNWEEIYANDEGSIFGGVDNNPLIIPIDGKVARYVRLQLNEENYLHLDEVEVYGR